MDTLVNLLGEHPCIVNISLGPLTVHYREVCLTVQTKRTGSTRQLATMP